MASPLFSFPLSPKGKTGFGQLLTPGMKHAGVVLKALGDGNLRISFGGRQMEIPDTGKLVPGMRITVTVQKGTEGFRLEILPQAAQEKERPSPPIRQRTRIPALRTHGSRMTQWVRGLEKKATEVKMLPLWKGETPLFMDGKAPSPEPLQQWVEAFLQAKAPVAKNESQAALFTLLAAGREGEEEGGEIPTAFRESMVRTLFDQGRLSIPIPWFGDGSLRFGHLSFDLGKKRGQTPEKRMLRAALRLDLDALGQIRADAALLGKEVQVGIGATSQAVLDLFREEEAVFSHRLSALGFHLRGVMFRLLEEEEKGPLFQEEGDGFEVTI